MKDCTLVFMPLRNRRPLVLCGCGRESLFGDDDGDNEKKTGECLPGLTNNNGSKRPYVQISKQDQNEQDSVQLGRVDFLEAMWVACSRRFQDGNLTRCRCDDCERVAVWAGAYIPRCLLRVEDSDIKSTVGEINLWVRETKYATMKYVQLWRAGGSVSSKPLVASIDETTKGNWMGPWQILPGDILRFLVPLEVEEKARDCVPCMELQLCCLRRSSRDTTADVPPVLHEQIIAATAEDASGQKLRNVSKLLSPRSRYAAALKILDEVADESDDDDYSGCIASQPFESQAEQCLFEALKPAEVKRHLHDKAKAAPSQSLMEFREKKRPSATSDTFVADPHYTTHMKADPLSMPTKEFKFGEDKINKDDTLSPKAFPAFRTASIQTERRDLPVEFMDVNEDESQNIPAQARLSSVGDDTLTQTVSTGHQRAVAPMPRPITDGNLRQAAAPQHLESLLPHSATIVPTGTSTTTRFNKRRYATSHLKDDTGTGTQEVAEDKFVLYFVEKGSDMHRTIHLEGLRKHAEQRGARVLDSFDKVRPPWPTHFVISSKVSSAETIATALGFRDLQEMSDFIGEHAIVCATRKWAARASCDKTPFEEPTIMEQYLGIRPNHKSKRKSIDAEKIPARATRQRKHDASPALKNMHLSELFHKLSKLHQECPLFPNDDWKAYSFQLLSGRLRHLDFEVTDDPETLKRLKEIKGFGDSSMQIIREYLRTGISSRIREFETDKRRVAMKTMMNIWGVGRVTALELVNAGYQRIGSVRQAVENGRLRLDRNQYIGLECYEDILEEMTRPEVETIAEIIFATVKDRFPSAEMTVMGSYRRGKPSCGDVDILLTHPDYNDYVPPEALGRIVDELRAAGHVAHHLTFISGMKHELFESLPASVANRLTSPSSYGRSRDKKDKYNTSSWMGVFNSPVVNGKRRRVDIKFYPYADRVFASLYFTGNGHFNRSMRLWATRKFNCILSDHGLLDKNTSQPMLTDPKTEKDVFDLLKLKWKEPFERDSFDAVEGICGETATLLPVVLSQAEIMRENQEHAWID